MKLIDLNICSTDLRMKNNIKTHTNNSIYCINEYFVAVTIILHPN